MQLTETEWKVMNRLWDRVEPCSARDVLEGLEDETGWAYTTVKTILARLQTKGAVKARMRANTSLYEPCITRVEARRSALRSLLERAFEGTFGSFVQFLARDEKLTKRERAELATMLQELGDPGGERDA